MLTKKIHRHDRPVVSTPPITGPMATATPVVAPKRPNAVPRSLPEKVEDRIARPVAKTAAPPMPWNARAAPSVTMSGANPQSAEPSVNSDSPIMKMRLRP